jgi:hypothetical protein
VSWETFVWRTGADTYRFELSDRGMIGRLSVSDGRTLALPTVAWEAMLTAVKENRKARSKVDANLPARAGARWTGTESDELAAKFSSGRSIDDLAQEHARTAWGIEGQLAKLGLWDKAERRRVA